MSACGSSGAAVAEVLLGFGGNLGDPGAAIEQALARLEAGGVRILRRSSFYRTDPWGVTEQPDFVNLCAAADTTLSPRELLALIHRVERDLGRERRERWGPRTIDIDILAYGDETVNEPDLVIPHPHLPERAFVLVPLAEIAPERVFAGRSVREWAVSVDRGGVKKISPPSALRAAPE
jgi:2-amino-4-hydroxy-6-hydroxymethyldihydropteridine diphosphokinase